MLLYAVCTIVYSYTSSICISINSILTAAPPVVPKLASSAGLASVSPIGSQLYTCALMIHAPEPTITVTLFAFAALQMCE
jgi:hypothetical protein